MAARTGTQFLAGLKSPRDIWVGDEKVDDVAAHPAFAGGARTMAQIFDLQHEAADVCLAPDPETGEADQRQPSDPALARGSLPPSRRPRSEPPSSPSASWVGPPTT